MNCVMRKCKNHNQEGMVLVVALILMVVLTSLGIAGIYLSTSDMKISYNYKQSLRKFYIAEAALNRGINALDNTPINEWSNLIAGASGNLAPDNPNAFVILKENLGEDNEADLEDIGIGNISYSVYVRNNFDDPSNDPSLNGDTVLVIFAEAGEGAGINKRIESAVNWEPMQNESYGGKNIDSENSGEIDAAIDWGP